jgi:hypothetical protein
VFTVVGVQTGIGEPQAFDRLAADDVRLDNFIHVRFGDVPIPDRVGIDHDIRSMLALIETTGLIGAHAAFESTLGEFLLEQFLKAGFRGRVATPSGLARRALVSTDEDMFFEFWHQATHCRTSSSVST